MGFRGVLGQKRGPICLAQNCANLEGHLPTLGGPLIGSFWGPSMVSIKGASLGRSFWGSPMWPFTVDLERGSHKGCFSREGPRSFMGSLDRSPYEAALTSVHHIPFPTQEAASSSTTRGRFSSVPEPKICTMGMGI